MKLNNIITVLFFGISQVFSQGIQTTEVKVLENFVPKISQADRLNENAIFLDTSKIDKKQNFKIIPVVLESDYKTRSLNPAKIKADKIAQLYKKRVSLGSGYRVSSKLDVVYNSLYSKDISSGIIFNHFSSAPEVDNTYAGKRTDHLHAYLKRIDKNKTYVAILDYDRLSLFSYGRGVSDKDNFDKSLTVNNPFINRFSYSKLAFLIKNTGSDRESLIREINLSVSDLNEFAENQIYLSTFLDKRVDTLPISIYLEYNNFLNYNNKGNLLQSVNVHSVNLMPSTSIKRYGYNICISTPISFVSDVSSLRIFPQVSIEKELVRDIVFVNGGIRQVNYRNTFKSLSVVNPYIHSYGTNQSIINDSVVLQDLRTTYIKEIYFSISNLLSKDERINIEFAYGKIDNYPYFILIDNEYYKRFSVNYIESLMQSHVSTKYTRKINTFLSLSCLADYYKRNKSIDHIEDFSVSMKSQINLRDKIYVEPSLLYKGKRESLQKELLPLLHINLNVSYHYSKQLSAYFDFKNLTNSKNEIWDSYKDIGFNAVFGVKYSF